jgi:hypothetical protein
MQNGNDIILELQTATETNNSGFEIQRRKAWEWERIGFINGNGTTTEQHHYSFTDQFVPPGKYQYRLKQIDFDGTFEYSNIIEIEVGMPAEFSLEQNYPNPFNPATKISWQLPVASDVTLKIFNTVGEKIATLVDNEFRDAGTHSSLFIVNSSLPSGVYLYTLQAGAFVETKKMIFLK